MDAGRKLGFRVVLLIFLVCAATALNLYNRYPQRNGFTRISMERAEELINSGEDLIIVDVRDLKEYSLGHIPGAVNIPLESIGSEKPAVLPYMDSVILVYCRTGIRSMKACKALTELGYTNIIDIGGIFMWTGDKETGI
ncbi:MAG: rhodanese-like domain-containing protein [Oscillospiraceae bacterium]|nr:rhodanese-like domain-containing protein [Oscillospiraceae bacterium]